MNIVQQSKGDLRHAKPYQRGIGIGADLTLVRSWIPSLKVLKFFGYAPIQIKFAKLSTVSDLPAVRPALYEFKMCWLTPGLACIILWAFVRTQFAIGIHTAKIFPGLSNSISIAFGFKDKNKSDTERLIQPLSKYIGPVMSWFNWITFLVRFPDFVRFLNNWQVFDHTSAYWRKLDGTQSWQLVLCLCIMNALTFSNIFLRIMAVWDKVSAVGTYELHMIIGVGMLILMLAMVDDTMVICMQFSVSSGLRKVIKN